MAAKQTLENRFVSEQPAADYLGLDVTTLRDWRFRGKGPVFARFGRSVRYDISNLEKFAKQCEVQTRER